LKQSKQTRENKRKQKKASIDRRKKRQDYEYILTKLI
jgi:hypothetical protein